MGKQGDLFRGHCLVSARAVGGLDWEVVMEGGEEGSALGSTLNVALTRLPDGEDVVCEGRGRF